MHSCEQMQVLEKRLIDKTFTLGVIGLGYVGLPLSLTFLRKGIRVIGFDLDPVKIEKLAAGESYIKHIPSDELTTYVKNEAFTATDDFRRLAEPDGLQDLHRCSWIGGAFQNHQLTGPQDLGNGLCCSNNILEVWFPAAG